MGNIGDLMLPTIIIKSGMPIANECSNQRKETSMTQYVTPDLCDEYPDLIQVVEPMFTNYGGRESFGGEIVTLKAFEDNSKVRELVATDGTGKVMVVDGGGSLRRAMLGDMLAEKAAKNGWEGIIIYGCIREIDVEVKFGGVVFVPGQYIYADNNGIIVSPEPL